MTADAVSKGAEKKGVIKFNQKSYETWSQARDAYRSVSRNAKITSVWNQVFVEAEDIEDDSKPFQLKCKGCKRSCQLNNPSKWKKEHNCKAPAPNGMRSASVAALRGARVDILQRCDQTGVSVLPLEASHRCVLA